MGFASGAYSGIRIAEPRQGVFQFKSHVFGTAERRFGDAFLLMASMRVKRPMALSGAAGFDCSPRLSIFCAGSPRFFSISTRVFPFLREKAFSSFYVISRRLHSIRIRPDPRRLTARSPYYAGTAKLKIFRSRLSGRQFPLRSGNSRNTKVISGRKKVHRCRRFRIFFMP